MQLRWLAAIICDALGVTGHAMHSLAFTYSELGRHADAADLQNKVLEFRRRVLPEDHPDIGDRDAAV